jgi:hypothetical protein
MKIGQPSTIRLRLRELAQLFNSMDPSPFNDQDLDRDAEEFIISWAQEMPTDRELNLVIHLATPPPADRAADVEGAVQHYFEQRAEIKRREFRLLMRRGRISLTVGLLFLAACLIIGGLLAKLGNATLAAIIKESFTIGGWVAMWRPLQIYLYDWWPLRADWRVLQRLCRMQVRLVLPDTPPQPGMLKWSPPQQKQVGSKGPGQIDV